MRGVRLINGKEPLLRQLAFEVRYDVGFNYLDRCGKILNRVSRDYGEWVIGNPVSPQGAPLYSMKNGCRFVFSSVAIMLTIDRTGAEDILSDEDVHDFAMQCEEMVGVVTDELTLTEFARIGFRAWYYFSCDSRADADAWIQRLGIAKMSPDLSATFKGQVESMSMAVSILGQDHRLRIGFESIEAPAQLQTGPEIVNIRASKLPGPQKEFVKKQAKERRRQQINAKYAGVIDFDSFQESPDSIDPRDFIIHNFPLFGDGMQKLPFSE
jgi:hypothetical protein